MQRPRQISALQYYLILFQAEPCHARTTPSSLVGYLEVRASASSKICTVHILVFVHLTPYGVQLSRKLSTEPHWVNEIVVRSILYTNSFGLKLKGELKQKLECTVEQRYLYDYSRRRRTLYHLLRRFRMCALRYCTACSRVTKKQLLLDIPYARNLENPVARPPESILAVCVWHSGHPTVQVPYYIILKCTL